MDLPAPFLRARFSGLFRLATAEATGFWLGQKRMHEQACVKCFDARFERERELSVNRAWPWSFSALQAPIRDAALCSAFEACENVVPCAPAPLSFLYG